MDKITEKEKKSSRLYIGITHGDINGIGYEVIIKSFVDQRVMEMCTPIVYGSSKIASYHRKTLNISDFSFNLIKKADMASPKRPNIINCSDQEVKIELGKSTAIAGELALLSLEMATNDLMKGHIDALVTAPINKKNIQSDQFKFPGHTEYLGNKFDGKEILMLMINENIRIGVATGHIPLRQVPEAITIDLLLQKLRIMNKCLIKDFAIRKPKIALLGLNPHAGDEGLLGNEEETTIAPTILQALEENILAFGPYSADGFFGSSEFKKFDGILAMYHDQGLIPFKTMSFDTGVNYTAGLPIVRTSPAHGTAYDLAGKNEASADSFRQAIFLACDIYNNRIMYDELNKNPLKAASIDENPNE